MFPLQVLRRIRKMVRRYEPIRVILRKWYRISQFLLAKWLLKMRHADEGLLNIDHKRVVLTPSRYDRSWIGIAVWHFGTIQSVVWDLNGYIVKERDGIYQIL